MPILQDTKYQPGEAYSDPKTENTGFIDDLKAIGIKESRADLETLLEVIQGSGKPLDDKKFTTERLIKILTQLPSTSKLRTVLTNKLIDKLWGNLQHPPLSYMGGDTTYAINGNAPPKLFRPSSSTIEYDAPNGAGKIKSSIPDPPSGIFKFRTPDGSYNNILHPDIGRAGTPYAKSVRSEKHLQGVRPDPALLFDLLMGRREESFKENPAGISSILFYHASIIIHDIFRTNRLNDSISDTSSYLDLAPLYGSSLQDQLEVRTMERGLLKPDTFHEKRLLGQPPGINVILIMYNRLHNYCADILLKINEGGRFTVPDAAKGSEAEARNLAKQDNDLFNTARLIVGGMYINISLHDYLRGITNTHHSKSDWTLDPRVEINKSFGSDGVPRGIGNQVSFEFNLLYRFHSAISKRDEKWTNEFLASLNPDLKKPIEDWTPRELLTGLTNFEIKINATPPHKREFGDMKRQADGTFKDAELVKILKDSIEDPAGMFGARMVPKALKVVETLGIIQARKWQAASLNEFREFFGLKKHETMEDINPDPEIADLLRNLYVDPDMVELYPGLFIEDVKPRMDTGCGICPPYSVGRAVLSDAVTLVRSDRFYTLDYTTATLTNWGMQEVASDNKTLGGSMFYKLIQRGLPGWFPFNSLHVMQPMFTKKMNQQIATEIGTIKQYTLADPAPPGNRVIIGTMAGVQQILKDQKSYPVPWLTALNNMFPDEKDYSSFMLSGDTAANTAQRNLMGDIMYNVPGFKKLLSEYVTSQGNTLLRANAFQMSKTLIQIDVIRDIAIPLNAKLLGDLFYMDLNSAENPHGALTPSALYKALLDVRTWGVNNIDPAQSWNRRRWAADGAKLLTDTTKSLVEAVDAERRPIGVLESVFTGSSHRGSHLKEGSLRWYGRQIVSELLAAGKSVDEIVDLLWLTAFGGIGVLVTVFAEILSFFFQKENVAHWAKIQELAAANTTEADVTLREYVLEAQRLTSSQRTMRVSATNATVEDKAIKKGDLIFLLIGQAGKDEKAVPDPLTFKPGRGVETISSFSFGPHQCLGKEIALTFLTSLIKLVGGLQNLRPAAGDMGILKSIFVGPNKHYLNDSWSYLTFDASTWKLHFDGYGKGVYTPPAVPVTEGYNLLDIRQGLTKLKTGFGLSGMDSK